MQERLSITSTLEQDSAFCEITDRILIISPQPSRLRTLVAELTTRCYDVLLFHHADDPLIGMLQNQVIVMDRTTEWPVQLPSSIVRQPDVPILSLVREGSPSEKIDDAVVWPSSIETLLLRISELSSRIRLRAQDLAPLTFQELTLDPGKALATQAGKRLDLTKTEFDLLKTLLASGGRALTRQDLMDQVWGEQYFGGSNSVDVHIKSLRQKLGDDPKRPRFIETVRGVGYRLAEVSVTSSL